MKTPFYLAVCCLILLSSTTISAQTDLVLLPDGSELRGELIDFQPGVSISLIPIDSDEILTFKKGEFLEVLQLAKRKVIVMPSDLTPLAQLVAQIEDAQVRFYFADGLDQKGEILGYESGSRLRMKVGGSAIYHFDASQIIAASYHGGKALGQRFRKLSVIDERPKPVYAFREQGWFQHATFAFTFGESQVNTTVDDPIFFPSPINDPVQQTTGFYLQHVVGYQFNRWVGVGGGLSFDAYSLEGGEYVLSLLTNYRAYLSKAIRAPYLGVSLGYGIPIVGSAKGFQESQGGLLFHPELGLRLGASEKANFTVSVGYRWQEAYYVQEEAFTRDILYRDLVYRRFVFGLGMLF